MAKPLIHMIPMPTVVPRKESRRTGNTKVSRVSLKNGTKDLIFFLLHRRMKHEIFDPQGCPVRYPLCFGVMANHPRHLFFQIGKVARNGNVVNPWFQQLFHGPRGKEWFGHKHDARRQHGPLEAGRDIIAFENNDTLVRCHVSHGQNVRRQVKVVHHVGHYVQGRFESSVDEPRLSMLPHESATG